MTSQLCKFTCPEIQRGKICDVFRLHFVLASLMRQSLGDGEGPVGHHRVTGHALHWDDS